MEEPSQLLKHNTATREDEPDSEARQRCPPQPSVSLPDQPVDPSLNFNRCRECLSALAHRLSQPMTPLRGALELALLEQRSATDYRSLLEQTLQLTDNMAQLIISLRDLAESGAPSGAPQPVSLPGCITEALAELEGFAQSRNLSLQLHVVEAVDVCANPVRLREAIQNLLGWVIQNSAGGGGVTIRLSRSPASAQVFIAPPRLDLQYLQIKVLEDITTPGLIFSHATKHGALGWAINQRLVHGLGGRLEMLTEGPEAGCIRATLPPVEAPAG